jgi:hypothetical protein
MTKEPCKETQFVLLEGPIGNRFYSNYTPESPKDIFKVLGYANSIEDAQMALYGRTFPLTFPDIE